MKCIVMYCNREAKCRDMCMKHYEMLNRVGRIRATEVEDHMIMPPEDRWWDSLPKQSELALNFIGGK